MNTNETRNPDNGPIFENSRVKLLKSKDRNDNNWSISGELDMFEKLENGNHKVNRFFMVVRASSNAMLLDVTEEEIKEALDYIQRMKKDGYKATEAV